MTEKKKPSIDELVKQSETQEKLTTAWINNFARAANQAYEAGMKAIGDDADTTDLDDDAKRRKFAEGVAGHYEKSFMDMYGANLEKKGKGKFKGIAAKDAIFYMSGATKDIIQQAVDRFKTDYTVSQHDALKSQHQKQLMERHEFNPFEHITEEHRDLVADAVGFKGDRSKLEVTKLREMFRDYYGARKKMDKVQESYGH